MNLSFSSLFQAGSTYLYLMFVVFFQGIVIGTGHNSEFGEVFKMMQGEEVCKQHLGYY